MAQPHCSTCGRFVGRDVRVLKYTPLRVMCADCTHMADVRERQQAREILREINARMRPLSYAQAMREAHV